MDSLPVVITCIPLFITSVHVSRTWKAIFNGLRDIRAWYLVMYSNDAAFLPEPFKCTLMYIR